jgi:tetratricopeptide (TPR) repeat protein
VLLLASSMLAGCTGPQAGHRFITRSGSGPVEVLEGPLAVPRLPTADAIARATIVARAARVPAASVATIESSDSELHAALANLAQGSTAQAYLRVALAYRKAGVLDLAIEHFDAALERDRHLAGAYDGRARIWRDWGLAGLALGDATRAVFFAPESPATHNTLGTVLLALGRCEAAGRAFREAVSIDSGAVYAASNVRQIEHALATGSAACHPAPMRGSRTR